MLSLLLRISRALKHSQQASSLHRILPTKVSTLARAATPTLATDKTPRLQIISTIMQTNIVCQLSARHNPTHSHHQTLWLPPRPVRTSFHPMPSTIVSSKLCLIISSNNRMQVKSKVRLSRKFSSLSSSLVQTSNCIKRRLKQEYHHNNSSSCKQRKSSSSCMLKVATMLPTTCRILIIISKERLRQTSSRLLIKLPVLTPLVANLSRRCFNNLCRHSSSHFTSNNRSRNIRTTKWSKIRTGALLCIRSLVSLSSPPLRFATTTTNSQGAAAITEDSSHQAMLSKTTVEVTTHVISACSRQSCSWTCLHSRLSSVSRIRRITTWSAAHFTTIIIKTEGDPWVLTSLKSALKWQAKAQAVRGVICASGRTTVSKSSTTRTSTRPSSAPRTLNPMVSPASIWNFVPLLTVRVNCLLS